MTDSTFPRMAMGLRCPEKPIYGRYVAFFGSVVLFRQMSPKGDWQDAFFTAIGGNVLVFIAFFFYGAKSLSEA